MKYSHTTISVSEEIKEALKCVGRKNETYDELMARILMFIVNHGGVHEDVGKEVEELIDKWRNRK